MTALERRSGEGPTKILVFEPIDRTVPLDERDYEVWCREIFADETWSAIEAPYFEDGRLRMEFSPADYSEMPRCLALEKHSVYRVGNLVRLFSEEGSLYSSYVVTEQVKLGPSELRARRRSLQAA
jgi:hypothetical protein